MAEPVIELTALDLKTDEKETVRLPAGTYVVTCTEPAHIDHIQAFANGTVQITIKDTTDRPTDYL